jgi:hypothetical protein
VASSGVAMCSMPQPRLVLSGRVRMSARCTDSGSLLLLSRACLRAGRRAGRGEEGHRVDSRQMSGHR